jgi:hypothetical protein
MREDGETFDLFIGRQTAVDMLHMIGCGLPNLLILCERRRFPTEEVFPFGVITKLVSITLRPSGPPVAGPDML